MNKKAVKKMLIDNEGLSLKPYHCTAGALSIAVGRNLDSRGVSEDEAMFMLENDIEVCVEELDRLCPWWTRLSENRQSVMIDLMFNLGASRLAKFVLFLRGIETADNAEVYAAAAEEFMDSQYAKQLPNRSKRNYELIKKG